MISLPLEGADRSLRDDGQRGIYLYCFTRSDATERLRLLPGMDGVGFVESLQAGDLAAVYCQVPLNDFSGPDAESHLQDWEWLAQRAWRHEQVIEAVMASAPVLPARFGAIFSSRAGVQELLLSRREAIGRLLDRVDGNEEWSVKVFLEMPKLTEWLAANDPLLAERRRGLSQAPGARYFQEKQLQAEIQRQAKQLGRTVVGLVEEALRRQAEEIRLLKLRGRDDSGREMIGHQAFLLNRSVVPGFHDQVEQLGTLYAGRGICIECSGPWPPYNFCPTLDELSR